MRESTTVHQVAVGAIPRLEPGPWRDELLQQLRADMRVVTLYGRRDVDRVAVTAVLQAPDRALHVSRTEVAAERGYHAMTTEHAALHCFERELHEQTGVRIAGHPWLKPIRYEGQEQSAMSSHPFYKIEGKEVHEVAVGPIHAGVIEPGSFRFMCLGEQVHHLEIHLGYQHRGVERRLLERDPRSLTPLIETIAGDTSVAHAWAHCSALESLAGCRLDIEVELARAVALELERVAMHLSTLAGMAADVGFLQGATTYGRLRTTAINTMMRLCGSRFGKGALRPGGVRMRLPPETLPDIRANLDLLQADLPIINDCFLMARTVQHRLRSTGTLTTAQARELGLVGLAARASGIELDARHLTEHGAYSVVPIQPAVLPDGDCWARARIRIAEIEASLSWMSAVIALYANWERPRPSIGELAPNQLAISVVEGFRGEVVHCIETGAHGEVVHYKVQDPSLRNWMGLALAVRGNEISDFPICNKSFDLSYCGNDL
ncbi:hydrogenase [Sorangium sp. So ce204]|uniref:hydrogenase large subunit n=1 Tax=Sorangium sp. So ce204 TaxID=3133288 RepID=UPI003F605D14